MDFETAEGAAAVMEAMEFLDKQKSLKPLKWSDPLVLAAHDHC
jgi:uncharacterized protein YkwD